MPSHEAILGKAFADGEIIIRQGEPGDCMFVVQSGTVEVVREEDGAPTVLAELGPNDFFGEMSLFERENRSATVRAKRDAHVLTVDRKTLFRRIQNDPSLALTLLHALGDVVSPGHPASARTAVPDHRAPRRIERLPLRRRAVADPRLDGPCPRRTGDRPFTKATAAALSVCPNPFQSIVMNLFLKGMLIRLRPQNRTSIIKA